MGRMVENVSIVSMFLTAIILGLLAGLTLGSALGVLALVFYLLGVPLHG